MVPIIKPPPPVRLPGHEHRRKSPFLKILPLAVIAFPLVFAAKSFIEFDENGMPRLAKWREQKMVKEINDLDQAEQYALRAGRSGWHPCYSCPDTTHIWLNIGEIWKYGTTTKGQKGRYGTKLKAQLLNYEIQYEGTLADCLKEEKRKIYGYALLLENLQRTKPLIRPPGNKKDF